MDNNDLMLKGLKEAQKQLTNYKKLNKQAAQQQSAGEIAELKADNERLREALASMVDMCITHIGSDYNAEIHTRYAKAKQVLATTPAQSSKG